MIVRTRSNRLARLGLVALVAVLAACSDDDAAPATSDAVATAAADTTTPSTPSTPSTTTTTTGSEPSTAPATSEPELREFEGQHVSVIGLWSGPELESFETVRGQWEQVTGAAVDWNGPRDLAGELQDELVQGTEPDVAILPSIGLLHQLAAAGELVPLRTVLDAAQLDADYSPPWLELGSVDGELYGIPYKVTDKSTVWYSPPAFAEAGATVPQTWDELLALADTMVADGRTPFSVVAPKVPGGGGWALTDWVSQLVLAGCGAEQYDAWVAGRVAWTDPCVRQAFDRFVTVVQTPGYVLGGSDAILSTGDAEGSYPLYEDPPTAYMYSMASFAEAFIADRFPDLAPGDDYAFFPFPTVDPAYAGSVTIGADVVVMLHDTPAARSFVAYLAGAESQRAWIELGGFTSVNRSIDLDAYADPVARAVAEHLEAATVVRYGAGDLMPSELQQAWWSAMRDLVEDPTTLPAALDELTATAAEVASG